MQQENAIEVKDLTKKFKVYFDKGSQLKEKVLFRKRNRYEERWVLNGISFSIRKGEAVGLIGHNGCGKSTTLKLLSRIIYPDSGSIEMSGRVSSLIELGAGFHPDMSGRENIYTNAAIFGLTKKEIDERLNDIIEFSELEEFIDNPVRTYSSGMYMRLAFSVAINVDADILLVDEILAVGDAAFQAKCFRKMKEIKAAGTTIVIVSHAMGQIEQICDRSIWIHEGLIREEGAPRTVDPLYMKYMSEIDQNRNSKDDSDDGSVDDGEPENSNEEKDQREEIIVSSDKRWGSGEVLITSVSSFDSEGKKKTTFDNTEQITFRLGYKARKSLKDVVMGVAVYREDQTYIYGTNSLIDYARESVFEGEGYVDLVFRNLPLTAGKYTFDFAFHKPDGFEYDFIREAATINISSRLGEVGIISVEHEWEVH